MKTEICTPEAAGNWLNMSVVRCGEHVKLVYGKAKRDLTCDRTGAPIPKGSGCYAVTVWSADMDRRYSQWEDSYIDC